MARDQTQQQASLYVVTVSAPWDRKATPIMRETFSRAALADLLLQVEAFLADGHQVTITPPANPARPPSRIAGVSYLPPQHLDVVDIQIID